jgi:hypothetical protein
MGFNNPETKPEELEFKSARDANSFLMVQQ